MGGDVVLYRDRWITCTDTELTIRGYVFPSGRPKVIPYGDIVGIETVEMGLFTGRGRLWGTASPRYWAHLDPKRPWKHQALVVDLGERTRPFITPDDPGRVLEILKAHQPVG